MTDLRYKALGLIEEARSHPVMFASNRGEYIARVSGILEMALDDFNVQKFYADLVPCYGSVYLSLDIPVDQVWADKVSGAAVFLLRGAENE
jgi:hypothetical protein